MWCRGGTGLATAPSSGQTVVVDFLPWPRGATQTMSIGHCSWLDRGLRPREPKRIIYQVPAGTSARSVANAINANGVISTFWVYNAGRYMKASAVAQGALTQKP
jgi:hypothetical protein